MPVMFPAIMIAAAAMGIGAAMICTATAAINRTTAINSPGIVATGHPGLHTAATIATGQASPHATTTNAMETAATATAAGTATAARSAATTTMGRAAATTAAVETAAVTATTNRAGMGNHRNDAERRCCDQAGKRFHRQILLCRHKALCRPDHRVGTHRKRHVPAKGKEIQQQAKGPPRQ